MKGILLCAALALAVIAQTSCAPVENSNASKPLATLSDDIARKAAELDKQFAMIDVNSDKMVEAIERRSKEIGDPSNLIEERSKDVDKLSDEMDDKIEQIGMKIDQGRNIEESVAGVRHTIPKENDQVSNKTALDIASDAVEAQGDLVEKIGNSIENSVRSSIPYTVLTPARRRRVHEESSENSGKTPFLAGRNTRGVIVPMNKKRMKKLIMFYYISKKYPTFVKRLLGKFDKELNNMPRLSVNESLAKFIAVDYERNKFNDDYNENKDEEFENDNFSFRKTIENEITPNIEHHRYDDENARSRSENYVSRNSTEGANSDEKMDQIMADLIETNLNTPGENWQEPTTEDTYKTRDYYDRYNKNRFIDEDIDHDIDHERTYQHKVNKMISNIMNSGTGRRALVKSELDELNMLLENNFFKMNKTKSSIFRHKSKHKVRHVNKSREHNMDNLEDNNDVSVNKFRLYSMKKKKMEEDTSLKENNDKKVKEEDHPRVTHRKHHHRHRKEFDPYATIDDIPTTPGPTSRSTKQDHSDSGKDVEESRQGQRVTQQNVEPDITNMDSNKEENIHGDRRHENNERESERTNHQAISEQSADTKQMISHSAAHKYHQDHEDHNNQPNSLERYFNAESSRKDRPSPTKEHDRKMINLLEYILHQLPSTRSIHFYHRVKDLLPILYKAHNVQDLDQYMKNEDQRENFKKLLKELPDEALESHEQKDPLELDDKKKSLSVKNLGVSDSHSKGTANVANDNSIQEYEKKESAKIKHSTDEDTNKNKMADNMDHGTIPDIGPNKEEDRHVMSAIELQNCLAFEAANHLSGVCGKNGSSDQETANDQISNLQESSLKEFVEPELKVESSESKSMLLENHMGEETNPIPVELQENGETREISSIKPKRINDLTNNVMQNSNFPTGTQPLNTGVAENILGEEAGGNQILNEARMQQSEMNLPGEKIQQLQNENIARNEQNPVSASFLQQNVPQQLPQVLQQIPAQFDTSEVNPDKVQKKLELYSQLQASNLGVTEDMLGNAKPLNTPVSPNTPNANIQNNLIPPKLWDNFNQNILNDMNTNLEKGELNNLDTQRGQNFVSPMQIPPQEPVKIEPATHYNGDLNYAL